ncbi:MAG: hypothetical protein AAF804_03135, partial [Bacteroidota bacterium]
YKPADLALLKVQANWNLPQLQLFRGGTVPSGGLKYWEVPNGTARPTNKGTRLSRKVPLGQIDTRLSQDQQAFARALCFDQGFGYPALNTTVIKFAEERIDNNHSGSPITLGNQIVGMVDGGAKFVNGTPCVWAIPATAFDQLMRSGTPPPSAMASCTSSNMYSGLRTDNPYLSQDLQYMAQRLAQSQAIKVDKGGLSYSLEYITTFGELYHSLFEDDQVYIREWFQEVEAEYPEDEQVNAEDLFNMVIHLYREESTGAVVAIPEGMVIKVDQDGNYSIIDVTSDYQSITMYVYMERRNSIAGAQQALSDFQDYMLSDSLGWELDDYEDNPYEENYLDDEYDPYYRQTASLSTPDGNAEFFATLTIDGTNFLGVAVQINDWISHANKVEERKIAYLLEVCSMVTDFAYY